MPTSGPEQLLAAVVTLVEAVGRSDAPGTTEALARLERFDVELAKSLEYEAIRVGVEQTCPDGVDGDDLRDLLTDTVRSVSVWWPGVDAGSLATVLTGSFGVHEPVEIPPPALVLHAAFVLAGLLATLQQTARAALTDGLERIRTAQSNDLP